MRLAAWWALEGYGALARLARETRVSYGTLHRIASGVRCASHATGKKIETATRGAVTADEVCAPENFATVAPNTESDGHGNTETQQRTRTPQRRA